MQTVTLGRTGLKVGKLALGGLFVAGFATELEEAKRAVKRAIELGINYIDTAPTYHNSEEVLGQCLQGIDKPVILSTKLGGRPKPFEPRNPAMLMESVKESLRLLGRDHVDILMIHEPDRPGQYDWWTDWQNLTGPALDVLADLKKQGVIRFTGIGGTTATELAFLCRTGKFDVVLTAYNYSLLYRESALDVMPSARSQKMGVIIGSPLQQGLFARRFDDAVNDKGVYWLSQPRREQLKALYALSSDTGIPLPEMGLRFILSQPMADCILTGVRSVAEVEQNVAAVEKGPLPADVLRNLDAIAAQVPFRPFGEPFGIGWFMPNPRGYRGMGVA
jgi:aryl-alcohol dehydrogenase-like predicted oxidoreductase